MPNRRPLVLSSTLFGLGLALAAAASCADFSGEADGQGLDASTAPADRDAGGDPDARVVGEGGTPDSCGMHERATPGGCVCAPGFANAGAGCVWSGILRDPEFVGDPADAWAIVGGALDGADGGAVTFEGPGSVAQTIEVPTLAEAGGALALRTQLVEFDITRQFLAQQELSFRGDSVHALAWPTTGLSTCLGERLMGRAFTLQASGRNQTLINLTDSRWAIDRMHIAPDPTCPLPGQIPNGNFDGVGGWTTQNYPGTEYAFDPGTGVEATTAARVRFFDSCVGALRNVVSVPDAPSALEYTVKAPTSNTPYLLTLGPQSERRRASTLYEKRRSCIPRGLWGQAVPVAFHAERTCTLPVEFFVDDVQVVADAACESVPALGNASFDGAGIVDQWLVTQSSGQGFVQTSVRAGNQSLALTRSKLCDSVETSAAIDVPRPETGGLALRFLTEGPLANSRATVSVGTALHRTSLAIDGVSSEAPTARSLCLSPESFGALVQVSLRHDHAGGDLDCSALAPTKVTFDDFTLVPDAACPGETP